MLKMILAMVMLIPITIFANNNAYESATIEEKRKELAVLKAEFDAYYKQQEKELKHKLNTIELKEVLIKKKEENIKKLLEEDKKILAEIKQEIVNKSTKVYNNMKPKDVAKVFAQMISTHKIDKVYSIIIKLKSQQVVKVLSKMNNKNSSRLTQMMLEGDKPKLKKENE